MRQTTEQNMINAFGGESMANMRYRHFAVQADKDNFPNVTRLFKAIAGETLEVEEMYPTYIATAKFQGERTALRSFQWSYDTEKMHKALFEKAREAVPAGRDAALGVVQVCEVCGYTLEGEAPEVCPVCNAKKERFTAYP